MSFVLPSTTTRVHRALPFNRHLAGGSREVSTCDLIRVKLCIRTSKLVGGDHDRRRRFTARSGSSIIKLLRVFILCLAASGTARADEAAQCRANAGTFLTGNVTQGPTFAPGRLRNGVELSHTHLTLLSDKDGRSYHVAIDNVFATGYDTAGESVPAPLSMIRTGDQLGLCSKLFTRGGLGIDLVHPHLRNRPSTTQPDC